MSRPRSAPADPAFEIGTWIPAFVPLLALGSVGVGLSLLVLQGPWAWVGVVLAAFAAVRARIPVTWALIALLVLGELARGPAAVGAELLVLIGGIHLLATTTLHMATLPICGRIELTTLGRPVLRFILTEAPTQVLALLVLALTGQLAGIPVAAAFGGGLLVLLAAVLTLQRGSVGAAMTPDAQNEGRGQG